MTKRAAEPTFNFTLVLRAGVVGGDSVSGAGRRYRAYKRGNGETGTNGAVAGQPPSGGVATGNPGYKPHGSGVAGLYPGFLIANRGPRSGRSPATDRRT